jgi:hypothetical protein
MIVITLDIIILFIIKITHIIVEINIINLYYLVFIYIRKERNEKK